MENAIDKKTEVLDKCFRQNNLDSDFYLIYIKKNLKCLNKK